MLCCVWTHKRALRRRLIRNTFLQAAAHFVVLHMNLLWGQMQLMLYGVVCVVWQERIKDYYDVLLRQALSSSPPPCAKHAILSAFAANVAVTQRLKSSWEEPKRQKPILMSSSFRVLMGAVCLGESVRDEYGLCSAAPPPQPPLESVHTVTAGRGAARRLQGNTGHFNGLFVCSGDHRLRLTAAG